MHHYFLSLMFFIQRRSGSESDQNKGFKCVLGNTLFVPEERLNITCE